MASLPQSSVKRSPRLNLATAVPTVLRLANGRCDQAQLRTVSLTGGLLNIPAALIHGARVKVMFVTDAGTIMGAAEMLKPVSLHAQPFRFTTLDEVSQRRLKGIIQPETPAGIVISEANRFERLVFQTGRPWRRRPLPAGSSPVQFDL